MFCNNCFSRKDLPDEILSDQGTQFTADTMREVMRLLSVSQLHSTPYHPQANGLVERFNGTLKAMLKKLMSSRPKDWDRYLTGALFAYREIPQEAAWFSPFELLWGRVPKGPTQLLYESWTGDRATPNSVPTSQYVQELENTLSEIVKLAMNAVQSAGKKSRLYKFKPSAVRSVPVGSKVLLIVSSEKITNCFCVGVVHTLYLKRQVVIITCWIWETILKKMFI